MARTKKTPIEQGPRSSKAPTFDQAIAPAIAPTKAPAKASKAKAPGNQTKPSKPSKSSILNNLTTRPNIILNRNAPKKRSQPVNPQGKRRKKSALSVQEKFQVRNQFVEAVMRVNQRNDRNPLTWKQYVTILNHLGSTATLTKSTVSKWAKGKADILPSGEILNTMVEALEMSTEEQARELRLLPVVTVQKEGESEDQVVVEESDTESPADTLTDKDEPRFLLEKPAKQSLVQSNLTKSFFTPIDQVALGAFIMFLRKSEAEVSCQEFLKLSDEAAVLIINDFQSSSSVSELLIQKRDVTVYKLSLKKYLSSH